MKLSMKKLVAGAFLSGTLAFPAVSSAVVASSANSICSATANPCVIATTYEVTGVLDFGARVVNFNSTGRLRGHANLVGPIDLRAGEINVNVGSTTLTDPAIGSLGKSVKLSARRSCSGNPATLCLTNAECAALGYGVCSSGNIVVNGMVSSEGVKEGSVTIHAEGNVTLQRLITSSSTQQGIDAGHIDVESFKGSVSVSGSLVASAFSGATYGDDEGYPGEITIESMVDVTILGAGKIETRAPDFGGDIEIRAGGNVTIIGDLLADSGNGIYANGGYIDVVAGVDLLIAPNGGETPLISTNGGGMLYSYGGESSWASGYGGFQYLHALDDVMVAQGASLISQGGPDGSGGRIELLARDALTVNGRILSQGTDGESSEATAGEGGWILLQGERSVTVGGTGEVRTASPLGSGGISILCDGITNVHGLLDVSATGGSGVYSSSGFVGIAGRTDVTIGGDLRGGGTFYSDLDWEFDVCRLRVTESGFLNNKLANPNLYASGIRFRIGERMWVDDFAKIQTDSNAGTKTYIRFRDAKKEPTIAAGTIFPLPVLVADPSIAGCPACGNEDVDEGETCDDGNNTSGDGCSADCQDEGCIDDTAGYPSVPLCSDNNECTLDECNTATHLCENQESCDDGVACTEDACVGLACEHAPINAECSDGNACTEDLCHASTGCQFVDVNGGSCTNGDFCSPQGTCGSGVCYVGEPTRSAPTSINVTVRDGPGNDKLKTRLNFDAEGFTADPLPSGMRIVISDSEGNSFYDKVLPSNLWDPDGATRWNYEEDSTRNKATIREMDDGESWRIDVKLYDAELGDALGQPDLSVAILFDEGGSDQCVSGIEVQCSPRTSTTKCRNR